MIKITLAILFFFSVSINAYTYNGTLKLGDDFPTQKGMILLYLNDVGHQITIRSSEVEDDFQLVSTDESNSEQNDSTELVADATLNFYIRTNIRLENIWTVDMEFAKIYPVDMPWRRHSLSVKDFIRVEQLKIGDKTFRPKDNEDDFVEKDAENSKIYPYKKITLIID